MSIRSNRLVKLTLMLNVVVSIILFFVSLSAGIQLGMIMPALRLTGVLNVAVSLWNIVIALVLLKLASDLYPKSRES